MLDKPAPPLPTRRWLKPDEAADYLGVSRPQFDVLTRQGVFRPTRSLGSRLPRYDVRELDNQMEANHGKCCDQARQAG